MRNAFSWHATAQVADPDEVLVKVTLTASAGQWKSLLLRVSEKSWPASFFSRAIDNALAEFTKAHEATVEMAE